MLEHTEIEFLDVLHPLAAEIIFSPWLRRYPNRSERSYTSFLELISTEREIEKTSLAGLDLDYHLPPLELVWKFLKVLRHGAYSLNSAPLLNQSPTDPRQIRFSLNLSLMWMREEANRMRIWAETHRFFALNGFVEFMHFKEFVRSRPPAERPHLGHMANFPE